MPKLIHIEKKTWIDLLTGRRLESTQKNLQEKNSRWFHWWILPHTKNFRPSKQLNRQKRFLIHSMKPAIPWYWNQQTQDKKTTDQSLIWTLDAKTSTEQWQTKFSSVLNYTSRPSGICSQNARMVQWRKKNQCIYCTNWTEEKTHMVISTDAEKHLTKFSTLSI